MFFFFKQKTAYEMRISDWSSDVCSSDLERRLGDRRAIVGQAAGFTRRRRIGGGARRRQRRGRWLVLERVRGIGVDVALRLGRRRVDVDRVERFARSEEHTSELQSLMRLSYAVFCLKKKK